MLITMIDDSVPFDGFTSSSRPLGGAEKAFAGLAGALARRGHEVHVLNRARYAMVAEGAHWDTMEKAAPVHSDVLIAFRKPTLLSLARLARKRILWLTGGSAQLTPFQETLENFSPDLVLLGETHARNFTAPKGLEVFTIAPGVRNEFLFESPTLLDERPLAVMTTHPLHGMDWALDLWVEKIRPKAPNARLVIVSAAMHKALSGREVPEELLPLAARIRDLADQGVEARQPGADHTMAQLYRSARLHLYPGNAGDMACWTLMESQASGLPAVARPLGAAPERVHDGHTGFLAGDDDAFAENSVRLLTDEEAFWPMSQAARMMNAGRDWESAAAAFERLFK